jgi:hypothetical protein
MQNCLTNIEITHKGARGSASDNVLHTSGRWMPQCFTIIIIIIIIIINTQFFYSITILRIESGDIALVWHMPLLSTAGRASSPIQQRLTTCARSLSPRKMAQGRSLFLLFF